MTAVHIDNTITIDAADPEAPARNAMVHDVGEVPPHKGASFGRGVAFAVMAYLSAFLAFWVYRAVTTGSAWAVALAVINFVVLAWMAWRLMPASREA